MEAAVFYFALGQHKLLLRHCMRTQTMGPLERELHANPDTARTPVINANINLINLRINVISIYDVFSDLIVSEEKKNNRIKNIEAKAKKIKKTAYSILE